MVTCEQGVIEAVEHGTQVTDAAGRTPGRGAEKPLLLTEVFRRATDDPDQPESDAYTFAIEASAPGWESAAVHGFVPARSWDTVRLVLRKAAAK